MNFPVSSAFDLGMKQWLENLDSGAYERHTETECEREELRHNAGLQLWKGGMDFALGVVYGLRLYGNKEFARKVWPLAALWSRSQVRFLARVLPVSARDPLAFSCFLPQSKNMRVREPGNSWGVVRRCVRVWTVVCLHVALGRTGPLAL